MRKSLSLSAALCVFALAAFLLLPLMFGAVSASSAEEYVGIGVRLTALTVGDEVLTEEKPTRLLVMDVFPGGPAEAAGLKRGDSILEVHGKPTAPMTLEQAVGAIRGSPASMVTLMVERHSVESGAVRLSVTVERKMVHYTPPAEDPPAEE